LSVSRTLFGRRRSWLARWPKLQERLRRRYLVRHTMAVRLDPDRLLCRILGPYKLYVDPVDQGITPHLITDGYWEPRTTEVIVDRLRSGMVAVDAGANLGYFTILMALLCGPRGHVHAFEPVPALADRIAASLHLNGLDSQVTLHRLPLSDREGDAVRLAYEPHYPGGAQITRVMEDGRTIVQARTRRLDAIAGARDAALVKIDTEGLEEAIWYGMKSLIEGPRLRWIVVEYTAQSYHDPAGLLGAMAAAGFRLMRIDDEHGLVATDAAEILGGPPLQMLLLER
jgi:FkbM family methyltransferase